MKNKEPKKIIFTDQMLAKVFLIGFILFFGWKVINGFINGQFELIRHEESMFFYGYEALFFNICELLVVISFILVFFKKPSESTSGMLLILSLGWYLLMCFMAVVSAK